MARRKRNNAERLRNSVYAMPSHTKEAMLRGIRGQRVIVGAYVDKRGGICPMLAAHRNGGRTNFGTFARAWDAFTGAGKKSRRASRREVRTLEGYLEMGLAMDGGAPGDTEPERSLAEEVRDVQASRRALAAAEAAEGVDEKVEDVLARTYAAAEERRAEQAAHQLHDTDELESAEEWADALERADAQGR